jgi:hypothetical protein
MTIGHGIGALGDHINHVAKEKKEQVHDIHHATSSDIHIALAVKHHLKSVQHSAMAGIASAMSADEDAERQHQLADTHHKLHEMHLEAASKHEEAEEAHKTNASDKLAKSELAHNASIATHKVSLKQHDLDGKDIESHDEKVLENPVEAVKAAHINHPKI